MGAAYYIVLESEMVWVDSSMDGKTLARHSDLLESIAKELGVRPLLDFLSMDAEALRGVLGDDAEGIEVPALQQFSAEEGLATIKALRSHPKSEIACHDLEDCERILTAAAEHGVRWHFQIDF